MPGWDKRLHIERPGAIRKECVACGAPFWVPPSKVRQRSVCSAECFQARIGSAQKGRERPCETCGALFSPRAIQIAKGGGRFCSQACNTAARAALLRPESLARAAERKRQLIAEGKLSYPHGPANKQWEGGPKAYRQRRRDSGAEAATLRAYRKANPDKAREFSERRKGRSIGRLPPGTIARIAEAQRHKCAICRTSIRLRRHVDHVMPLARGGAHEARNIQILCPPCNVRKNAKDPIDYMRSLGRLL